MVGVSWFLSLGFIPFGISKVVRIWDVLFHGDHCLFALTVNMIELLSKHIQSFSNTEDILCFFLSHSLVNQKLEDCLSAYTHNSQGKITNIDYLVKSVELRRFGVKLNN